MSSFLNSLMPPLIVFLVVVAPIWLVLHYRSKRHAPISQTGETVAQGADPEVAELWQSARRMEDRIRTLERILDADSPNWRSRA